MIPSDLRRFEGDHDGLDRNHSGALSARGGPLRKRCDRRGMGADRAASAAPGAARAATQDGPARCRRRDPVPRDDWLPVAATAEGVSALFDRSGLLLRLARRGALGVDQPRSGHGGARAGRPRGEPDGRRDRQPDGEDHRKRRPWRLRCRQEDPLRQAQDEGAASAISSSIPTATSSASWCIRPTSRTATARPPCSPPSARSILGCATSSPMAATPATS